MSNALRPILSRVRTDVTALKNAKGSVAWTKEPLTKTLLQKHFNGGPARGVSPIKAGESVTRLAVLDLDSHKGATNWAEMVDVAQTVCDALRAELMEPITFRSSGGKGIHIYLLWDEPQDAYSVRVALKNVLISVGYRDGAKGVAESEIEIFPKQDSVPHGGFGNQFFIPMAGKSEPIDMLFGSTTGIDGLLALEWPISMPVLALEKPAAETFHNGPGKVSINALRSALTYIVNDGGDASPDYFKWRDRMFAIHEGTNGSEEGFQLLLEFSENNPRHDQKEARRLWGDVKLRPDGISHRSILSDARDKGWQEAHELDFEDEGGNAPQLSYEEIGKYVRAQTVDRAAEHLAQTQATAVIAKAKRATPVAIGDGVILTRGSDLTPRAIDWLWLHWLARGKLAILAGAPGQGKTTIALRLIATVTSGGRWPDGSQCPSGNALMWSGEDDPADTLAPRLIAAGADLSRVYFVTGARVNGELLPFDPARDLVQLTAQAEAIGDVRLLVVDPVASAVTGDSHKNTEVRRALQPLVDLGAYLNAAVLGISHFSKGTAGRDPTERVTGSVAFGAVARIVLVAAKVKGDDDGTPDRRVLARSKSNIGPDDGGFEYSLEQIEARPGIVASRVLWGKAIDGTARDLLSEPDDRRAPQSAQGAAEDFLRVFLTTTLPVKAVEAEAIRLNHAWRTVLRAADSLGVNRKKTPACWVWSLPASDSMDSLFGDGDLPNE